MATPESEAAKGRALFTFGRALKLSALKRE